MIYLLMVAYVFESLLRHTWDCCCWCVTLGFVFIFMVNNSLNRNKCHHHTVHGLSRNEIWPTSLLSSPMSRFNLHQMIRKIYYPIVIVWLWVSVIWRRIYIYSFHYLFLWVSFHRWKLYCAFHSNMILYIYIEKSIFQRDLDSDEISCDMFLPWFFR